MYIEMNFLVGLIGGVVIGMVITCILVFVICLAVIGSLKEKEEENNGFYPEQFQGEPNMECAPEMEQPVMSDNEFPSEEPVTEGNNSSGVSLQKDNNILKDDDPSMQHMTKEPEIDLPSSEISTE